jgi:hypothetical protein
MSEIDELVRRFHDNVVRIIELVQSMDRWSPLAQYTYYRKRTFDDKGQLREEEKKTTVDADEIIAAACVVIATGAIAIAAAFAVGMIFEWVPINKLTVPLTGVGGAAAGIALIAKTLKKEARSVWFVVACLLFLALVLGAVAWLVWG